jgi:hypothetical protein
MQADLLVQDPNASEAQKQERALALAKRAEELADLDETNKLEMGMILLAVTKDPELAVLAGAKSVRQWAADHFGKRMRMAEQQKQIVETLLSDNSGATTDDVMAMSHVNAYQLSRMIEHVKREQRAEWIKKAKEMAGATFKHEVEALLKETPDHRDENWTRFTLEIPTTVKVVFTEAEKIAKKKFDTQSRAVAWEGIAAEFYTTNASLGGDENAGKSEAVASDGGGEQSGPDAVRTGDELRGHRATDGPVEADGSPDLPAGAPQDPPEPEAAPAPAGNARKRARSKKRAAA